MRKTEFIVALNKVSWDSVTNSFCYYFFLSDYVLCIVGLQVDRLYGWKTYKNVPIWTALKKQKKYVQLEFNQMASQVITQFMEEGLNSALFNKNKDMGETYSVVPTSAVS